MTYTWNSTTKNIHIENLGLKFNRKLDKIKRHLVHFSENSVHLEIAVEKNSKKELFTAKLTLHVPSNVLHAEKSAGKFMTAFDNAADALVREIQSLKADLCGAEKWESKERRGLLHAGKATRFAPIPSLQEISQPIPEILPELFHQHRSRLGYELKQMIRRDEDAGVIPRDGIDAENIMDEVERIALRGPNSRPAEQTYKVWFFSLAQNELQRRCEKLRRKVREMNSSAEFSPENESASYQPSAAHEIRRRKFEPPPTVPLSEVLGEEKAMALEGAGAEQEFWEELNRTADGWPDQRRAVFDLHFLGGFGPVEISALNRMPRERVEDIVSDLHIRVGRLAMRVMRRGGVEKRELATR